MQIARPQNGFNVVCPDTVTNYVLRETNAHPEFARLWSDLISYLKIVAHRTGVEEPRLGKACRLFTTVPEPEFGQPRIVVGYKVLGDTVSIRILHVAW